MRQSAAWAVKAARWRVSPDLVPLTVTFHPPDRRRRDDDGMIASFKAARDGIADALGVDDNCFRPTYRFGEPVKGGAIIVEMHEDAPRRCDAVAIGELVKPLIEDAVKRVERSA